MANYFFSFIIFVDRLEKLEWTLDSMKQSPLPPNIGVQLLIVSEKGEARANSYADELEQAGMKCDYLDITDANREEILELALDAVEGEYVNITKAGVLYPGDSIYKVYKYARKSRKDRILVPGVGESNTNVMKEINAFRKQNGRKTDLNNNYHIIHCNYFSYFIRKTAFCQKRCLGKSISLEILKKIFFTIVSSAEIGYAAKANIIQFSTHEVSKPWEEMIKEECIVFCKSFLLEILEFCKQENHICIKNAKYNLVYYCSRILNTCVPELMTPDELSEVRQAVEGVFAYIEDDEIILFNQYIDRAQKFYLEKMFSWKNDSNPEVRERRKEILDSAYAAVSYQFMDIEEDKLVLECRVPMYMEEDFEVYFKVNGKLLHGVRQEVERRKQWFGQEILLIRYVKCEIPLSKPQEYRIKIVCDVRGKKTEKKAYAMGKFMPLTYELDLYYQEHGWNAVFERETKELVISPADKKKNFTLRKNRLISLLKLNNASRKAALVRLIVWFLQKFLKKDIWLVSDRANRGDDNGEIFFRYLCDNPVSGVKPYFVIAKDVPDFKRMKQYGKVIPVYSWRHKILHLISSYVISSQANKPVINPYGAVGRYYSDFIAKKKIVFLQHGVIKDDLSGWLNRYNRNLYGFVVTTKPEYDSILDYDYYYSPKEVWLTGLPRHDALIHDEKKYITVMPTWRKTLSDGSNAAGIWKVDDDFVESSYFQFYDALLNHERLLSAIKKHGYHLCFMPHPNVKPALGMFHHHPDVTFWGEEKSYREMYAESSLLVTDYSSAVFDFAYLRKPIIYCQFDREEFFSGGHSYVEGYYNYLEDGFGEVEEDLEGTVSRIIEYMERGCVLKEEYAQRIERTFAYHDKECSRRVVDKILGKTLSDIREA